MKYKVLQIDAWGNENDGWESNNFYCIGNIELSDEDICTDQAIIERLIQEDYFTELARGKFHDPYNDNVTEITIAEIETGKPVFHLQSQLDY